MTNFFAGLDDDLDNAVMKCDEPQANHQDMRGRLTTALDAQRFMLAGKSVLTLVSKKTATRFTYRITVSPDGQAHFVALLSGPDNEADYQYLGRIARGVLWLGRKVPRPGDIGKDAPSAIAFDWVWRKLAKNQLPDTLEIWHEGRCGRCGRKLTVPSSVALGFGPECAGKI